MESAKCTVRVLIVDDDPVDVRLVERLLGRIEGCDVTWRSCGSKSDAVGLFSEWAPEIVFIDFQLGPDNGIDLIREFQQTTPSSGFVLMTGQGDEYVAAEALRAGAMDYLIKGDLTAAVLERSLRYILDRLRARTALQESEARFRSLAMSASDAIVVTDAEGGVVSWNAAAERMFGYGEEEILGKHAEILMPDRFRKRHQEGMARFLDTGEPRIIGETREYEGLRKDGTVFPVELSLSTWIAGRERFFSAIIRDVTDRRRAADILRAIFETALDCVVTMDHEGLVREFNTAAEQVFGYSRDEAIGRDLAELIIPPDMREKHHAGLRRFLETGEGPALNQRLEMAAMRKSGEVFDVELSITAVPTRGAPQFTGYLRDITDRKRAEEALHRSNEDLQQFAYAASHDLQEPLRMVTSYLQLLERKMEGRFTDEEKEYFAFAIDGGRRMQALIRDLLEFSRVSTHGQAPEPVDSGDALDEALQNLGVGIEESGAVVTRDAMPVVTADASQLVRLFQNLVGNGLKYVANGNRPEIHVGAAREGGHAVFSVRDNGIGIAPEYFERIFAVFQRLHGHGEYSGTGIGLSVCKRIVERHGGRIWLESEPGKGTTFFFTLPMA